MNEFTVTLILNFKDGGMEHFMKAAKDPKNGLAKTKKWSGYKTIEFYGSETDKNQLILWERWETKKDYESYLKMREETGFFDKLTPFFTKPPQIIKQKFIQM